DPLHLGRTHPARTDRPRPRRFLPHRQRPACPALLERPPHPHTHRRPPGHHARPRPRRPARDPLVTHLPRRSGRPGLPPTRPRAQGPRLGPGRPRPRVHPATHHRPARKPQHQTRRTQVTTAGLGHHAHPGHPRPRRAHRHTRGRTHARPPCRRDHRRGRSPAPRGRGSRPVPPRPPLAHHPCPRKRRPVASRPTPLPLGHVPHPARRAHPTPGHPRRRMVLVLFHLRTLTLRRRPPPPLRPSPQNRDPGPAVQLRVPWGMDRTLHGVPPPPRAIPAAGWSWSFSTYEPSLEVEAPHLTFGPPDHEQRTTPFLDTPEPDY